MNSKKVVKETSERNFIISVHDDDYKFVEGHVRNGNVNILNLNSKKIRQVFGFLFSISFQVSMNFPKVHF